MPNNKPIEPAASDPNAEILAAVAAFGGLAAMAKARDDAAKLASLGNFETVKKTLGEKAVAARLRANVADTAPESLLAHCPAAAGQYTVEIKDAKIRTAFYTVRHTITDADALAMIKSLPMCENRRLEFTVTLGTDSAPVLGTVTSTPMRIGAGRHAKADEPIA
jgi:hypothetical protein